MQQMVSTMGDEVTAAAALMGLSVLQPATVSTKSKKKHARKQKETKKAPRKTQKRAKKAVLFKGRRKGIGGEVASSTTASRVVEIIGGPKERPVDHVPNTVSIATSVLNSIQQQQDQDQAYHRGGELEDSMALVQNLQQMLSKENYITPTPQPTHSTLENLISNASDSTISELTAFLTATIAPAPIQEPLMNMNELVTRALQRELGSVAPNLSGFGNNNLLAGILQGQLAPPPPPPPLPPSFNYLDAATGASMAFPSPFQTQLGQYGVVQQQAPLPDFYTTQDTNADLLAALLQPTAGQQQPYHNNMFVRE